MQGIGSRASVFLLAASVIRQFPVAGYLPDPPAPPLSDLLEDWTIAVRFGDRRFERVYRRGDSNKTLLLEFQRV